MVFLTYSSIFTRRVGVGALLQPVYPVVYGFPDVQQAGHLVLDLVSLIAANVTRTLAKYHTCRHHLHHCLDGTPDVTIIKLLVF